MKMEVTPSLPRAGVSGVDGTAVAALGWVDIGRSSWAVGSPERSVRAAPAQGVRAGRSTRAR